RVNLSCAVERTVASPDTTKACMEGRCGPGRQRGVNTSAVLSMILEAGGWERWRLPVAMPGGGRKESITGGGARHDADSKARELKRCHDQIEQSRYAVSLG